MNRYDLIDYKENVIYSIEKVDIDFEENETGTSSVSCTDKIALLQETIKNTIETLNARCSNVERYHLAMYLLNEAFDNLDNQTFTNDLDFNEILQNRAYPFGKSFDEVTHDVREWYYDNSDIIERN